MVRSLLSNILNKNKFRMSRFRKWGLVGKLISIFDEYIFYYIKLNIVFDSWYLIPLIYLVWRLNLDEIIQIMLYECKTRKNAWLFAVREGFGLSAILCVCWTTVAARTWACDQPTLFASRCLCFCYRTKPTEKTFWNLVNLNWN